MDIDAKRIQAFLWKALNFTLEAFFKVIQAYPKASAVTITVLLLYAFLPLLLLFLICSLVVSAIAIVVYRVYFRDDLQGLDNVRGYKKTEEKSSIFRDNDTGKNVIVLAQSETTRRRNVNEKDREQRSNEDKSGVRIAGKNADLVDKTAVVEDNLKEIREVNVHSGNKKAGPCLQHQTSDIVASPPFTSGFLEEGTHLSGVKGEYGESSDDSEEEDGRENRNKAVEWSVDDQMNLSHVGNIEMERNTRLENLIARRRARKLLDIHVRNTLMRTNDPLDRIPSLITARKNHFLTGNSELSPIPGSAPSVLLPMHKSPFDISFDPEKEKLIQTGDSFKKEILADQQKEATLCRHESFGRGTFSPRKSLQHQKIPDFSFHHGPSEKIEASTTGHQSESTQGNEEDANEVETKQIVHEKIHERSKSSSSSEENIPLSGTNKDQLLKSLSSLAQKDVDSDRDDTDLEIHIPYNTDRLLYQKTEGNSFFGDKRMCHAPSNSLASDLQVEVSEVGSPQSTSSNDKSNIFDDYINKEVTSGGEDMLADSSHLSGVEINESNTREVNEASTKENTDAGSSSTNHSLDPNTSDSQPEKVVQQEEISSHSQPFYSNTSDLQPEKIVQQEEISSHMQPTDPNTSDLQPEKVVQQEKISSHSQPLDPNASDLQPEKVVRQEDISSHSQPLDLHTSDLQPEKVVQQEEISSHSQPLDPTTSDLQPEKVVRQEEVSSHSQPSNLPNSIQGQTTDVNPDHPVSSNATDAPSEIGSEDSTKQVVAHTSTSENLKEAPPEEVNVVNESVMHNSDGNEGLKSREVIIEPEAVAEFPAPVMGIDREPLEDTSNNHSDLNTSNTSVPVSDEKDPSASQNTLTQDREEANVTSHNNKPVTIENEAHTKSEPVKDSEGEATLSVKNVDMVEPSNPNDSKASQDIDENVKRIVGDDNAVDTLKATEEIKNIESDAKNNELQEAEPHKDINQHLASDGNDNTETKKVVESESSTSTPNEAVTDSKQIALNDDSGKTSGHAEVEEQLNPHQQNSTVESNIVSQDNKTVNNAANEKETKPANIEKKKSRSWKFF
ncbi:hypothetical protein POM88_050426 [Heracleum sosnowskyi]|uniref:Uncharacterized protein n=1 Tax=Heracleum sosnowskyi TaxID=360622 RepID=A0AAD8GXI3_9APIA|nr:hypothetical protein POM88_050426 [Heracleum sosnowskyi]